MNSFLKNLGIIFIILGTVILLLSYVFNWVDYNWPNGLALLMIVGGIVTHIIMNKRIVE